MLGDRTQPSQCLRSEQPFGGNMQVPFGVEYSHKRHPSSPRSRERTIWLQASQRAASRNRGTSGRRVHPCPSPQSGSGLGELRLPRRWILYGLRWRWPTRSAESDVSQNASGSTKKDGRSGPVTRRSGGRIGVLVENSPQGWGSVPCSMLKLGTGWSRESSKKRRGWVQVLVGSNLWMLPMHRIGN